MSRYVSARGGRGGHWELPGGALGAAGGRSGMRQAFGQDFGWEKAGFG